MHGLLAMTDAGGTRRWRILATGPTHIACEHPESATRRSNPRRRWPGSPSLQGCRPVVASHRGRKKPRNYAGLFCMLGLVPDAPARWQRWAPMWIWWWGGTLRQTYVTQRLTAAANSCGKARNPAPSTDNPTSSARPGSPAKCIMQDASSIPVCGIEPASAIDQSSRTGRAILGLRAWLAVWRLADLERIRSIAWLWW